MLSSLSSYPCNYNKHWAEVWMEGKIPGCKEKKSAYKLYNVVGQLSVLFIIILGNVPSSGNCY